MSKEELRRKSILDRVKEGYLSQREASSCLNLSYRQTKRVYQRYLKESDQGLTHKNRGKRSARAYSLELKEQILFSYQDKYEGFGPTLACEKFQEDGFSFCAETLRLWLKEAGLWHLKRKQKAYRTRRERRPKFGELLQLDGSIHRWFEGLEERPCLMNLVDDATGKTLSIMAEGETTEAAFLLLKQWIELHGVPQAVYVDLKNLYVSPKSLRQDSLDEGETHFSKACKKLGIKIIKAYSPQAKGRVERSHGVYQDRLVKELRLQNITTIQGANQLLQNGFIDALNRKFMKEPQSQEDGHRPLTQGEELEKILCWQETRVVCNDWTFRYEKQIFQITKASKTHVRPRQKIIVQTNLDGQITLWNNNQQLAYQILDQPPAKPKVTPIKKPSQQPSRTPWRLFNPNWLQDNKKGHFHFGEQGDISILF